MKVELLDHMGSDLDVVNAARVSFDKESGWVLQSFDEEDKAERYASETNGKIDYDYVWSDAWMGGYPVEHLSTTDAKLISYLAKHQHWTPFSHCYAKFRIKAPLFVRSQLFKHKVGLTENEVSRRYVDSEPEFYVPEKWRKRADNVKQGSADEEARQVRWDKYEYTGFIERAIELYLDMLADGVCPEQARMVLPQSMMTEWIWSGTLAAFARVYKQRTSEHAQYETRTIAYAIGNELRDLFPVSWEALTK